MKKYDDDLEFGSLNEDSRDYRFIVPIIIVAVLLVIVIAALILIGKNGKNKDTSADPVATEQSGTTEEEAQNTEVMGAVEATESAEETDADDPKKGNCAPAAPAEVYGHTGFTGTCAWVDPVNELVYVFLSNRIYPDVTNRKLNQLHIRERIQGAIYDAMKKK